MPSIVCPRLRNLTWSATARACEGPFRELRVDDVEGSSDEGQRHVVGDPHAAAEEGARRHGISPDLECPVRRDRRTTEMSCDPVTVVQRAMITMCAM